MFTYNDVFYYYVLGNLTGGGGAVSGEILCVTEGVTSVTFESTGKPLVTYRVYGSAAGVGDLNEETGKYEIEITCNEAYYTIILDNPLTKGQFIDYKTQKIYPKGTDIELPEIDTIEGTNTLTAITENPASKVYVECYRLKDIPIPVDLEYAIIGTVYFDYVCEEDSVLLDYSIFGNQSGSSGCGEYNTSLNGYEVPVTVQGTLNSTTTRIYIGETQLMEDEYISFSEQKIYRKINNTLTPVDPPVLLPEIPCFEGANLLTVDTTIQPSKVYIEYTGEGKQYPYYITSDGYILGTSDNYKYGLRS